MTPQKSLIIAHFKTNKGTINITLHADRAPLTVANFINLAQLGYYDGLKFHRVIASFMIQGGCPHSTGYGGPGYRFEDEFHETLRHHKAGILSMANAGPKTNGSQFFITHGPTPHLDDVHSVFGEVVSETDQTVVNAIRQNDLIESLTITGDTAPLMSHFKDRVHAWNTALCKEHPSFKARVDAHAHANA